MPGQKSIYETFMGVSHPTHTHNSSLYGTLGKYYPTLATPLLLLMAASWKTMKDEERRPTLESSNKNKNVPEDEI
jgi:hypothetical protein